MGEQPSRELGAVPAAVVKVLRLGPAALRGTADDASVREAALPGRLRAASARGVAVEVHTDPTPHASRPHLAPLGRLVVGPLVVRPGPLEPPPQLARRPAVGASLRP